MPLKKQTIIRKIIAQNITNLSDARYFAAWGVDYLSFNIIPDSEYSIEIDELKEIKEWVEGPKTLIESTGLEFLDFSDGHILNSMYASLPLNKEAFFRINFEEYKKGLPAGKYIIKASQEDLSHLDSLSAPHDYSVELFLDINNLSIKDYEHWPEWGLVVQGGEEEKVGLKSFDELDDLYALLMP